MCLSVGVFDECGPDEVGDPGLARNLKTEVLAPTLLLPALWAK